MELFEALLLTAAATVRTKYRSPELHAARVEQAALGLVEDELLVGALVELRLYDAHQDLARPHRVRGAQRRGAAAHLNLHSPDVLISC